MSKYVFLFCVLISLTSCDKGNDTIPETATSGTLKVAFDESFLPIVHQEKEVFQFLYKYAHVQDTIIPQEHSHDLFLKDSVRLIFSSRRLNDNERKYLKSVNVFPKEYEFAQDGLALILHPSNQDTILSVVQLKKIVSDSNANYKIVVENSTGASIVSLIGLLNLPSQSFKSVFSAQSSKGVIDYVSVNKNAIGLISSTMLSDFDSPKTKELLKKVKIGRLLNPKTNTSYYPFQSELADSLYLLKRTIYVITRETKMGIANGFASFLLGEKGQRVVLKSGLLPARIPSREVVLSKKSVY